MEKCFFDGKNIDKLQEKINREMNIKNDEKTQHKCKKFLINKMKSVYQKFDNKNDKKINFKNDNQKSMYIFKMVREMNKYCLYECIKDYKDKINYINKTKFSDRLGDLACNREIEVRTHKLPANISERPKFVLPHDKKEKNNIRTTYSDEPEWCKAFVQPEVKSVQNVLEKKDSYRDSFDKEMALRMVEYGKSPQQISTNQQNKQADDKETDFMTGYGDDNLEGFDLEGFGLDGNFKDNKKYTDGDDDDIKITDKFNKILNERQEGMNNNISPQMNKFDPTKSIYSQNSNSNKINDEIVVDKKNVKKNNDFEYEIQKIKHEMKKEMEKEIQQRVNIQMLQMQKKFEEKYVKTEKEIKKNQFLIDFDKLKNSSSQEIQQYIDKLAKNCGIDCPKQTNKIIKNLININSKNSIDNDGNYKINFDKTYVSIKKIIMRSYDIPKCENNVTKYSNSFKLSFNDEPKGFTLEHNNYNIQELLETIQEYYKDIGENLDVYVKDDKVVMKHNENKSFEILCEDNNINYLLGFCKNKYRDCSMYIAETSPNLSTNVVYLFINNINAEQPFAIINLDDDEHQEFMIEKQIDKITNFILSFHVGKNVYSPLYDFEDKMYTMTFELLN